MAWLNSGNYKPTNQNGPFEKQTKAWRAAISKQPIRIGFDGRDGNQNKAGAPTSIILKKMSQN